MATPERSVTTDKENESIATLVSHLAEQTAALSRQEVRLAQLELREKGKAAGLGAGMLGAAGIFGLFGLAAALSAAGAAIALALPVWASALIIAAIVLFVAGVLALVGRRSLKHATPPTPTATQESVREDVAAIKESARR